MLLGQITILQDKYPTSMFLYYTCISSAAKQTWQYTYGNNSVDIHYNMIVEFFPGFDRSISGFDRFIPGFDRFILACIPVTGTLPHTIQMHNSQWNVYCFALWCHSWKIQLTPIQAPRLLSMPQAVDCDAQAVTPGSDRSHSGFVNSMQAEPSEKAVV